MPQPHRLLLQHEQCCSQAGQPSRAPGSPVLDLESLAPGIWGRVPGQDRIQAPSPPPLQLPQCWVVLQLVLFFLTVQGKGTAVRAVSRHPRCSQLSEQQPQQGPFWGREDAYHHGRKLPAACTAQRVRAAEKSRPQSHELSAPPNTKGALGLRAGCKPKGTGFPGQQAGAGVARGEHGETLSLLLNWAGVVCGEEVA